METVEKKLNIVPAQSDQHEVSQAQVKVPSQTTKYSGSGPKIVKNFVVENDMNLSDAGTSVEVLQLKLANEKLRADLNEVKAQLAEERFARVQCCHRNAQSSHFAVWRSMCGVDSGYSRSRCIQRTRPAHSVRQRTFLSPCHAPCARLRARASLVRHEGG